jgi:hypothetical protein
MSQATAQPVFETTATALREKKKLRRHFRRFDMFFYLLGTRTRQQAAAEPVSPAYAPVGEADPAP